MTIPYLLINPRKMAAMRSELESLRAIVGELATSDLASDGSDGHCVFCGNIMHDPISRHEADCLITRAREAIQ